jgi:LmbE family N-acetylglucosaminyl deacetylase
VFLVVTGLLTRPAAAGAVPRGPYEPAPSAGQLARDLRSLQVAGSVLYVAAHPDDENTRLIAWLQGERGLDVTYLSITRGGGGQNLIGTEQGELLGLLRTEELLAARQIDGGQQRFTRARDFGYSKSAEESIAFWGREAVLDDVVAVVREVEPDVILTRFPTEGETHGHHLASARLASEAFEKAAVSDAKGPAWQASRLIRNESSWRIDDDTDTSGWLTLDVGTYDPLTGRSWAEVAADARTMHKSQGFGSRPRMGPVVEYFSAVSGDVPPVGEDLFAGLPLTWSRFEGGARVDRLLAKAVRAFDPTAPHTALPSLFAVREAMQGLPDRAVVRRARSRLDRLILECAGVWMALRAERPDAVPGGSVEVELQATRRGPAVPATFELAIGGVTWDGALSSELTTESRTLSLAADQPLTQPAWLRDPPSAALYAPEGASTRLAGQGVVRFDGLGTVAVQVPVEYVWTDYVHGERRQPLEVLPPVTATFGQRTRLVPIGQTAPTTLTLRAHGPLPEGGSVDATVLLEAPPGSRVEPAEIAVSFTDDAREHLVPIELVVGQERGSLVASVRLGDGDARTWSYAEERVDHPHVPRQTVLSPAALSVSPVALDRGGVDRVAYLQGSGDAVPTALRDLGYAVDLVDLDAIREGGLDGYEVAVLGIRSFNAVEGLLESRSVLYDWVARGGRLVVQYTTSNRWRDLGDVGPAPLEIDRSRVTDETAPMRPIDDQHPLLQRPNRITSADYDGWVQERGLYFAETWDDAYTPVFRMNDPGEDPHEGALLVLQHGDGTFIYTGLSFFRQLPAGVPGAARLFANLLAHDASQGGGE